MENPIIKISPLTKDESNHLLCDNGFIVDNQVDEATEAEKEY